MSATFHHAGLDSPRLAKLLDFLRAKGSAGATTLDLAQGCVSTRPSSDVSELRANGLNIVADYERETATGRRVFRYRLVESEQEELGL
jgi:hypothetical protein